MLCGHSTVFEQFERDVTYAFRTLLHAPAFTLAALGSLVLGIGANTASIQRCQRVLLRPLPYQDPDRVVLIYDSFQQQGIARSPACVADFLDWKRGRADIFQSLDAIASQSVTLTGDGQAEQVAGRRVTATFFQTLGVNPLLGRTFSPGDDQPGRTPMVMISERLWRRAFWRKPLHRWKGITLNGSPFTVVGVMPGSFRFGGRGGGLDVRSSRSAHAARPLLPPWRRATEARRDGRTSRGSYADARAAGGAR